MSDWSDKSSDNKQDGGIVPVLAAIILNHDSRVLLAQRKPGKSNALKWEFPGGKLKAGESPESCLAREIEEELGLKISVNKIFSAVNYTYPHASILLLAYSAELTGGRISLNDHVNIQWVPIEKLITFDLSPADIPVVEKLMDNFKGIFP